MASSSSSSSSSSSASPPSPVDLASLAVLGVLPAPLPPGAPAWAPHLDANPLCAATGLAPSPPRLPLPPLHGELTEGAHPTPPPSHVCTDALLEDALDSFLLASVTDPAGFGALAALREEEAAWRRSLGGGALPSCPGGAAPTSLELLASQFRGCMTAFLQRQCDYAAAGGRLSVKFAFAVDTEAYLRYEMLLLGRAAAHFFSSYHRALGRDVPVTWATMLAEFRREGGEG
jgi:hypothetical protein